MPTAAKLAAALCLTLTALATTYYMIPALPENQPMDRIYGINLGLGFIVGWVSMGPRSGRGLGFAISNGVTSGFILVFWALVVFSAARVWHLSFGKTYRDPFDAVQGFFENAVAYVGLLSDVKVISSLVIGSLLAGLITEIAGRNFN